MFRVMSKDGADNAVFIQGARSHSTSNNIASIVFQNFDNDSKTMYNMAAVAVRDHYGNADVDGMGDLLLLTRDASNATGLIEQVRLTHDGNLGIGTSEPTHRLHVEGDICTTHKLIANEVETNVYRVIKDEGVFLNTLYVDEIMGLSNSNIIMMGSGICVCNQYDNIVQQTAVRSVQAIEKSEINHAFVINRPVTAISSPILSIQRQSALSCSTVRLVSIDLMASAPSFVQLWVDGMLTGAVWTEVNGQSSTETCMRMDTSASTIQVGKLIWCGLIGAEKTLLQQGRDIACNLDSCTTLSVCAMSIDAAGGMVSVVMRWEESCAQAI